MKNSQTDNVYLFGKGLELVLGINILEIKKK